MFILYPLIVLNEWLNDEILLNNDNNNENISLMIYLIIIKLLNDNNLVDTIKCGNLIKYKNNHINGFDEWGAFSGGTSR